MCATRLKNTFHETVYRWFLDRKTRQCIQELFSIKLTLEQIRKILRIKLLDNIFEQISRHVKFNSARSTVSTLHQSCSKWSKILMRYTVSRKSNLRSLLFNNLIDKTLFSDVALQTYPSNFSKPLWSSNSVPPRLKSIFSSTLKKRAKTLTSSLSSKNRSI